jgi:hypothetical protein
MEYLNVIKEKGPIIFNEICNRIYYTWTPYLKKSYQKSINVISENFTEFLKNRYQSRLTYSITESNANNFAPSVVSYTEYVDDNRDYSEVNVVQFTFNR